MGIHDGHREKMRQRFLTGGLDGFADHEALELLLYYAIPRRDTNPIAHALMERYGSLSAEVTCWSGFPGRPGRSSTSCAWTGRESCWPASAWGRAASPTRIWTSASWWKMRF